jgi:hypothetical protein
MRVADSSRRALTATAVVVAATSFYFITERGLEYVAWPTLNRPEETMYYDGPGYSSGRHGRAAVPGHYDRRNTSKASTKPKDVAALNKKEGRRGY